MLLDLVSDYKLRMAMLGRKCRKLVLKKETSSGQEGCVKGDSKNINTVCEDGR